MAPTHAHKHASVRTLPDFPTSRRCHTRRWHKKSCRSCTRLTTHPTMVRPMLIDRPEPGA
eukprot:5409808-Prymnesium_polylepis.1